MAFQVMSFKWLVGTQAETWLRTLARTAWRSIRCPHLTWLDLNRLDLTWLDVTLSRRNIGSRLWSDLCCVHLHSGRVHTCMFRLNKTSMRSVHTCRKYHIDRNLATDWVNPRGCRIIPISFTRSLRRDFLLSWDGVWLLLIKHCQTGRTVILGMSTTWWNFATFSIGLYRSSLATVQTFHHFLRTVQCIHSIFAHAMRARLPTLC